MIMRPPFLLLVLASAFATGCIQGPACERFNAAEVACREAAEAAGVDLVGTEWEECDPRSVRGDEMHGGTSKSYVCLAAAHDDEDCTTRAGVDAVMAAKRDCED